MVGGSGKSEVATTLDSQQDLQMMMGSAAKIVTTDEIFMWWRTKLMKWAEVSDRSTGDNGPSIWNTDSWKDLQVITNTDSRKDQQVMKQCWQSTDWQVIKQCRQLTDQQLEKQRWQLTDQQVMK